MRKELAQQLKKVAAELRVEAVKQAQLKTIKCAQILTAAKGLLAYRDIVKGNR